MPQHTEKQQTNGKTDSETSKTAHLNPMDQSEKAVLRRRFKKLFGYKPCNMDTSQIAQAIAEKEAAAIVPTKETNWKDNY